MDPQAAPEQPMAPLLRRLLWVAAGLLVVIGLLDWWYLRHKERRYDPAIVQPRPKVWGESCPGQSRRLAREQVRSQGPGKAGEIGLMQIRSLTAQEWAQAAARPRGFDGNLFEPELNLQVGTWYLGKLLKRYARTDRPVCYALADYNAGRSNVLRWNKGAAETNAEIFLAQMTFPGTQDYVRAIVRRAEKYQALHVAALAPASR